MEAILKIISTKYLAVTNSLGGWLYLIVFVLGLSISGFSVYKIMDWRCDASALADSEAKLKALQDDVAKYEKTNKELKDENTAYTTKLNTMQEYINSIKKPSLEKSYETNKSTTTCIAADSVRIINESIRAHQLTRNSK